MTRTEAGQPEFTEEKYAARDLLDGEWDPRAVSARALIREGRQPERLFAPGNHPQDMKARQEYSLR